MSAAEKAMPGVEPESNERGISFGAADVTESAAHERPIRLIHISRVNRC